jgi:hypothetical protein
MSPSQRTRIITWISSILAFSTIFYNRTRIYYHLLALLSRKQTIKDSDATPVAPPIVKEDIDPRQAALKFKSRIDDLVAKTIAIHESTPGKIHSTSAKGTRVSSSGSTKRGDRSVDYDPSQLIATIKLSNYDIRLEEAKSLSQVDAETSISYKLQKGK